MARHSSLRASDADRDAVAERLRQAAVEGRLDPDELEQRLHAALRARTYGELDRLLADLPATPVKWERPRAVAPAAGVAVVMVVRALVALAILGAVLVAAAAALAWWMVGLIVFLVIRSSHGCRGHRRAAAWHRPPHVRRV
jgi:Flp pilus assembly protein TadB